MRHAKAVAWEEQLKQVFDSIDHQLEEEYGARYSLHPSRKQRGSTSNPEADGLFNIGAVFTPGFGSQHGPGYVVEVQMATLSRVADEVREEIEERVVALLREGLKTAFPGRTLDVSRDGGVYKIHGDLKLGSV